jgi:DNA-binding winged helix-turn-helix (wHTH) protein
VFLFEGFRLDRRGLFRRADGGYFVPVPLGSRALEVLIVLVERAGDLVSRDQIMKIVWPGVVVENSNLPVQVAALRRVLDDGRSDGSCIQTVPGRGYRFTGTVCALIPMRPRQAAPARCRHCRSWSCRLPISAMPDSNSILQMGSPKTSRPTSRGSRICS